MPLPRISLSAGNHRLEAQVARSEAERDHGLMHRTCLPDDEGMLFVYEQPSELCFWMKDTPLPLSIAFLAEDGTVLRIEEMEPQTREPHCPPQPVRYVLEMNSGWFARRGIRAGDRLEGVGAG